MINTPTQSLFPKAKSLSAISRLAATIVAGMLLMEGAARAQTLKLRFTFTDAAGGTTTASDTSTGGVNATLGMFNAAGAATDLHGALGSGVNGALNNSRAMCFTNGNGITQPGNATGGGTAANAGNYAVDSNDAALGFGNVTNFVVTMWFNQFAKMPSGAGLVGPRPFILNAGAPAGDTAVANSIGVKFQQANQLYFSINTGNPTLGVALSSDLPTNRWLFFAWVYDGTNLYQYHGSDAAAAQLDGQAAAANQVVNLGGAASLIIGNRSSDHKRSLNGWFNDFRFYTGAPTSANALAFVENIRQSIAPHLPIISGIFPDGTALLQATNKLVFNAISSSGLNLTNIGLVLNGVNVSAGLQFVTNGTAGTSTNVSVTYPSLPQQITNSATMSATDALGLTGSATVNFDTFSTANLIIKAEEFNFMGGQFIDNPDYTDGNPADANSYFGLDSVELIDTHKGAATAGVNDTGDYRATDGFGTRTQTPVATGELLVPKYSYQVDGSASPIPNHMVSGWSSAEWQNYTKTFPAGNYNVYARLSTSSGSTIRFDQVTSDRTQPNQTTANLGSFSFTGSGSFQWVPLLKNGTLAVVNLAGVNTVRATTGGGANANLYMLVPANPNLPVISGVFPDGQFLFETTNKLAFTASSGVTTISTNNITLSLNGTDVSSQLAFSGGPSTWHVSYTGLQTNQNYTVVIHVTDANSLSASATLNIDTWNPVFQVEAEDFDFDPAKSFVSPNPAGHRYIDNAVPTPPGFPAANSYEYQVGDSLIDEGGPNPANPITAQPGYSLTNYRTNDYTATTMVTDAARRQFAQANALDYNIGFIGPGFWQEYTRTWPSGTFNLYGRMASGANAGTWYSSWSTVQTAWGTTNQVTQHVGSFAVPTSGGYSAYIYTPLIDRFGNYAQLTLGGTNTFRATELVFNQTETRNPANTQGGININFYMLTAPRTDLPRIDNVIPDGSTLMQQSSTLSFAASSPTYGVGTSGITVTLNGNNISPNLVFTGASPSWNVSYPHLQLNTNYSAIISITDSNLQTHTTTVNFDTFNPNNFTWEAEDFDFGPENSTVSNGSGLRYIDNPTPTSAPAANSYFNQIGDQGIDESPIFFNTIGTYAYRSTNSSFTAEGVGTEVTGDAPRQKYLNAQLSQPNPYISDYDVNNFTNGAWLNYTRTFPTGNFYLYARLSAGNGAFAMTCAQVTNGFGTPTQMTQPLGSFVGTGASFGTWQYVPLVNTNTGLPVTVSLGGVETLQMTGDGNEHANFFMLASILPNAVIITPTINGSNIQLSFPTQTGFNYTIQYKHNLTDPSWTQLGSSLPGNGSTQSVSDSTSGGRRFYRLSIQ